MNIIFYIASLVAVIATIMVITRRNTVHALLYLIVSLLAVSVIFFVVGAPFVAALEVIVYAGAIMVLFVFAIMMLNLGKEEVRNRMDVFSFNAWLGPGILTLVLLCEFVYVFYSVQTGSTMETRVIGAQEVSETLFGPYVLGVELTGMLLMSGIIGAYHIGKEKKREYHRYLQNEEKNE